MDTKNLKIVFISDLRGNVYFRFELAGFVGLFRIPYTPKGKGVKAANSAYFDGYPDPEAEGWTHTHNVQRVTDAMLFVERHMQWILDILNSPDVKRKGYFQLED